MNGTEILAGGPWDAVVAFFLIAGGAFTLIGAIGLVRLPDFYTRLHAPTKATTLGVGNLLVASSIYFSTRGCGLSLHELLIAFFLFLTAPVSAHLMARAGRQEGLADRSDPVAGQLQGAGTQPARSPDSKPS